MFGLYVWRVGIVLEALILFRGWLCENLKRFPFFYPYIAATFVYSAVGYILFTRFYNFYPPFYWAGQYVTLLAGCGLIVEIFDHVLMPYPGAKKFARVSSLYVLAFSSFLGVFHSITGGSFSYESLEIGIERDLRFAQAALLSGIFAVILYYFIPLNRAVRGMMIGYCLYLFTSLITLALRYYIGNPFDGLWRTFQPLSYDISLTIWAVALWNYSPVVLLPPNPHLDEDYEELTLITKSKLKTLRSMLGRSRKS